MSSEIAVDEDGVSTGQYANGICCILWEIEGLCLDTDDSCGKNYYVGRLNCEIKIE